MKLIHWLGNINWFRILHPRQYARIHQRLFFYTRRYPLS